MHKSADAEAFARRFFFIVSERSQGNWVASRDVFAETMRQRADTPYAIYLRENTKRQAGVTELLSRVGAEFPSVVRDKRGQHQAARVFFRTEDGR